MRRLYHHLIIGTCRGEFPGAVTRVVGELSRSLIQMDATSGGQKCWLLTSVFVLPSLPAYLKPFMKSV
ncbi:hypothetical protein P692DRAFT_20837137 [Suillus brevipes Sb2]|nr:hypothetical protein P692DRAFT_20837137 [Suillus brevipes Sb2]